MTDVVYLECIESGASKFWSGTVEGEVLTTRWGKIGTQGGSKEEAFADAASARASLDKQPAAMMKKGYKPVAMGAARKQAAAPTPSQTAAQAVTHPREEPNGLPGEASDVVALLGISDNSSIPQSSFHFWLSVLAGFPMTPDNKALTRASRDTDWFLRLGAVLHPLASDAVLELLSADDDVDVARAAPVKLTERSS